MASPEIDLIKRNNPLERVMAEHGVAVFDLHAVALAHRAEIQPKVDVHFTKPGYRLLGEHVAAELRQRLRLRD